MMSAATGLTQATNEHSYWQSILDTHGSKTALSLYGEAFPDERDYYDGISAEYGDDEAANILLQVLSKPSERQVEHEKKVQQVVESLRQSDFTEEQIQETLPVITGVRDVPPPPETRFFGEPARLAHMPPPRIEPPAGPPVKGVLPKIYALSEYVAQKTAISMIGEKIGRPALGAIQRVRHNAPSVDELKQLLDEPTTENMRLFRDFAEQGIMPTAEDLGEEYTEKLAMFYFRLVKDSNLKTVRSDEDIFRTSLEFASSMLSPDSSRVRTGQELELVFSPKFKKAHPVLTFIPRLSEGLLDTLILEPYVLHTEQAPAELIMDVTGVIALKGLGKGVKGTRRTLSKFASKSKWLHKDLTGSLRSYLAREGIELSKDTWERYVVGAVEQGELPEGTARALIQMSDEQVSEVATQLKKLPNDTDVVNVLMPSRVQVALKGAKAKPKAKAVNTVPVPEEQLARFAVPTEEGFRGTGDWSPRTRKEALRRIGYTNDEISQIMLTEPALMKSPVDELARQTGYEIDQINHFRQRGVKDAEIRARAAIEGRRPMGELRVPEPVELTPLRDGDRVAIRSMQAEGQILDSANQNLLTVRDDMGITHTIPRSELTRIDLDGAIRWQEGYPLPDEPAYASAGDDIGGEAFRTQEDIVRETTQELSDMSLAVDQSFLAGQQPLGMTADLARFEAVMDKVVDQLQGLRRPQRQTVKDAAAAIDMHRNILGQGAVYATWAKENIRSALKAAGATKDDTALIVKYIDNPTRYATPFSQLSPEIQRIADTLRKSYDDLYQVANEAGILDSWVENYINRIWRDKPGRIKKSLYPRKRLDPKFEHALKRRIPVLDEGIERGLDPVLDPAILNAQYQFQMYRSMANNNIIDTLRNLVDEDGLPLVMGHNEAVARDALDVYNNVYRTVAEIPTLKGIGGKAHPDIASALSEAFSPVSDAGKITRAYLKIRGKVKRILLFNPLIHGSNVFSNSLVEANLNPVKAAKVIRRGSKLWKAQDDLVQRAVGSGLELNTTFAIASDLRREIMKELPELTSWAHPIGKIEQWSDKVLWEGIVRNTQLGLFEHISTRMKKLRSGRFAGARLKNLTDDQVDRLVAAHVNTLMGTLPYNWMSRNMRRWGSVIFLARNWTYSNMDIVLKGLTRGRVGLGVKAFTREEQKIMGSMMAEFMGKGMLGLFLYGNMMQIGMLSLTNQLKEQGVLQGSIESLTLMHQNEKGNKISIKTGFRAKTGANLYYVLPLFRFMRDMVGYVPPHTRQTLWNKMEPMLRGGIMSVRNIQSWRNQPIIDTAAPKWDWFKQGAGFLVESFTPKTTIFGQEDKLRTWPEKIMPFTGGWIRRGPLGGEFGRLLSDYKRQSKYKERQIDVEIDQQLQQGEFVQAVKLMATSERYKTFDGMISRVLKYPMPLNYFWNNLPKDDKIQFIGFLKEKGYSPADFGKAMLKERMEMKNRIIEEGD
jgi:hypothetical protein